MEKQIWTIEDIKKDYEHQGLSGRSKQDFLDNVEKRLKVLEILLDKVEFSNLSTWYINVTFADFIGEEQKLLEEVM